MIKSQRSFDFLKDSSMKHDGRYFSVYGGTKQLYSRQHMWGLLSHRFTKKIETLCARKKRFAFKRKSLEIAFHERWPGVYGRASIIETWYYITISKEVRDNKIKEKQLIYWRLLFDAEDLSGMPVCSESDVCSVHDRVLCLINYMISWISKRLHVSCSLSRHQPFIQDPLISSRPWWIIYIPAPGASIRTEPILFIN